MISQMHNTNKYIQELKFGISLNGHLKFKKQLLLLLLLLLLFLKIVYN